MIGAPATVNVIAPAIVAMHVHGNAPVGVITVPITCGAAGSADRIAYDSSGAWS